MNPNVLKVQKRLLQLGYNPGPLDGIRGRMVISAVREFQKDRGLVVDGMVGRNTYAALFDTTVSAKPEPKLVYDTRPWLDEAYRVKGLHEVRNKSTLWAWLRSDGGTVGDPTKVPWCFAGDVEILTEIGWQRLDALTASRVCQVDETGEITLTGYFPVEKDYDGIAYKIQNNHLDIIADTSHKWWGNWGTYGRNRTITDDKFDTLDQLSAQGLTIKPFHGPTNGDILTDEQLHLLAAYISDGTIHKNKIRFQVSKTRKITALQDLAPVHQYQQKQAYGILTKTPLTELVFDIPIWLSHYVTNKHLHFDKILNWSKDQARTFLLYYANYDGNIREKDGRITLYTSDEHNRDALITLVGLAGLTPNIEPGGKSNLTKKESWRIGFSLVPQNRRIMREHVSEISYTGKMYCVTVPSGRIVIRGKNKLPVITGNCGDFVQTAIALSMPNEAIPTNPYLAANWMKFGYEVKPQLGSILVFWRGSPSSWKGHVGFYVGETNSHFLVMGGNQSNAVTETLIAKERLRNGGSRWPNTALKAPGKRIFVDGSGKIITTNEE